MSNENLTAEEKRNMEKVKDWAKAWETDSARSDDDDTISFIDEYYADTADVVSAIHNFYFARRGQSKELWRTIEIEDRKKFRSGKITILSMLARGDTVAVEMEGTYISLEGETHKGWGAAFFKFDKDGKMISDRTYNSEPRPTKENWSSNSPEEQAAIEKILEDNK